MSRQKVLGGEKAVEGYSGIEMTRSVGADGMAEEEYTFNSEVTLVSQNPIWKEKYKPRKPRFFNRVHTVSVCVCDCSSHGCVKEN